MDCPRNGTAVLKSLSRPKKLSTLRDTSKTLTYPQGQIKTTDSKKTHQHQTMAGHPSPRKRILARSHSSAVGGGRAGGGGGVVAPREYTLLYPAVARSSINSSPSNRSIVWKYEVRTGSESVLKTNLRRGRGNLAHLARLSLQKFWISGSLVVGGTGKRPLKWRTEILSKLRVKKHQAEKRLARRRVRGKSEYLLETWGA